MNVIEDIIVYFDDDLKMVFSFIDVEIKDRITEIRVRANQPLSLVIKNRTYFVDYNGDIYDYVAHNVVIISSDQVEKLFLSLCEYSIYSNIQCLKNGFVTLKNGARVGIASSAVYDDKKIISVKHISSLNIRIPRQVLGCSISTLNQIYNNFIPSVIVAGMPNSGKTTFLRDMAYQLSNGYNEMFKKVAVIDERNEIAGKLNDMITMNIGACCDVLTGFKKSKGIEIATRTLSPELIVCDEIASDEELESIINSFSCGISFAVSVHIKSVDDLKNKSIVKKLLSTNEFSYIILLDNYTYIPKIIDVKEVSSEIHRYADFDSFFNRFGIPLFYSK